MDKDKTIKNIRNKLVKKDAMLIESTLESFGIIARVVELNYRPKDTEFCLELALGTPLENVVKLNKDLAMTLASPTGDVEIVAPIPGRPLIAVRLPFIKKWYEERLKNYDEKEEKRVEKLMNEKEEPSGPTTFLDYLSLPFLLVATIFEITGEYFRKLGNFINGRRKTS